MRYAVFVVFVIVVLGALWWFDQHRQAERVERIEISALEPVPRPEPRFPVPAPEPVPEPPPVQDAVDEPQEVVEPAQAMPALADSDAVVLENLVDLLGADFVERWVRPELIVPRVVAIVHSLDGSAPAEQLRPLITPGHAPRSAEAEDDEPLYWSAENAHRYTDLIAAVRATSPNEFAERYRRHYPLFQQAWEELGETEPYFNDRLVDIIDHLLDAPTVELPIEVVAWEGRLHFASESLQEQSWGRKQLIRMGPDQAAMVKDWLRELRREVTGEGERTFDQ